MITNHKVFIKYLEIDIKIIRNIPNNYKKYIIDMRNLRFSTWSYCYKFVF